MFFLLVQTIGFGATITSTGSGGFWDLGGSWAGGVVPTASDDVVIANGTTITVRTNRTVNNVTVQSGGVLTILNNIILTVNGSVLVNSGGQFNAGTGNNDSAIIKVFGNFTNQGTANFWKSTVVIKGDFITSGTSLQQNGNIIVGGNVTAAITGSGNGYVYPVNPYAVVSVTGTSNAQPAGTKPTDWQLINYMNEVIYGGVNCDASAGTVYSNFSTFCINDTMDFWSTGWSTGGSWSSSNPSVLTIGFVSGNSGNGRATAIASGTADVIYTVKQAGCVDKISIKKITVGAVGAISADQSICTGNNITSDITIESATGTIQWKRADNAAFTANVINLGTNSKTLTIAQVGTLNATKYFRAVVTGGTCGAGNSAIVTVTVNAAPTVPTGTASQSFCSGASPTVANLSATGTAIKWYAASSSGSALASTTALVSGTHYFATQTVNGCESTSRFDVTVTLTASVTPSVAIAITSGSNPSCSGSSVTFTATPTNGGTPTYQWTKNGTNIGGATFATYTGVAGTDFVSTDIIRCVLTPTAICVSPSTAISSGITMTVTASVTPSVAIAITSGSNPSCSGSSVTFTATPTNGGTPTYQWTKNGTNIGGATSATYTGVAGTDFVSTDIIRCVLTPTAICVSPSTATSSGITMTVTASVTPSVAIAITSGSNPSCSGSSVTFTATPTNGGTPTYQWTKNGTNIGGATSATYTGVAGTDFVSTDIIRCVLTPTAICVSPSTATSSGITMTVTASVTPSVAIAVTSGSNPSCSGSSVTFTATPTNGGTPTYQWTKNGTNIGGATSATYTGVAGTDFVSTDIIRCVLTPTAICVSPSTATSSGITMTVTANATPSVAIAITSGSNPSCSGSSVTFTATPTNGGTPTYQWTKNGTNIGGATSATYTGVAGTDFVSTDIIRCVLTPTAICVSSSTATSNTITTVVNPTPTITAATQPMFACEGSPATINLTGLLAGSTSTISYTINSGSVQTATGVVADPSGAASFNTGNLITADNNKTLEITGVATTSTSPSCTKSVTGITVNLNVKSNSGVISLNGLPIPSLGTTYSPNSNAVFSIDAVAGAAYSWIVPSGWSIVSGDGTNQIIVTTGTNPQGGSVTVMVNSLCSSSSLITLSSIPLPALNANSTPIKCGTLGNVTLNNLPSGNWTLTVVKDGAVSFYHESGATRTVGSLSAGTYTFTITDQFGGSASANVTMDAVTKTWKDIGSGLGWYIGTTPSSVPTLDDIVVFEGDYTISGSINACSCTVKAGVNITIAGGKVLTVENGVHVETGIAPVLDGTLTFENGASLIQNNDAKNVNTGSIIYKRTATSIKDFDYVYWSSPVAGQKLGVLSPQSDLYWSWLGDYWTTATAGETMIEGKGYIARVPRYVTSQTVNFIGTPTNGDVTIDTQGALKSNLIGNPYPSAIDAEDFMVENVDLLVDSPMLAFWTHYTPRDLNGNQYVYEAKDYSFINATGVVSADSGRPVSDGNIAAGQSFMVGSQTDGSFKFTNEMRIGDPDKNNTFFKQIKSKKTVKKEKNRIWLNLTNEGGAFKQLLVGYVTGATNDADKLFDGTTRNSNTYVDFYSIMKDKNYSIQGRGLPFDEEDQVPLGYKSTIEGTLQISIDKTDGFMTNQTVYLEDKVTNVIHDLTKGSYSFTTAKGEFKDRFILRYTNTSKLGTGDFDAKGKGVIVSVKNSQIKINSFDSSLSSVKIFDLKGSLLYEKDKVGKNEFTVDHLNSSNQFMIVMVQLEDGKWISEEIIFHD